MNILYCLFCGNDIIIRYHNLFNWNGSDATETAVCIAI